MRIRKRQVPLPFSSISPVPLPSDPNSNRSPVVQLPLQLQQPQPRTQPPIPYFDLGLSSDHTNNHPIGRLPTQSHRDSTPFSVSEQDYNKEQRKGEDYLQGDEEEKRGEEKSNDTRKKNVLDADLRIGSSSSHQVVGRWGERERAFPLKKRRGIGYDDDDDDKAWIMEEDNNSNNKKTMNNKKKKKMKKKFDDNHGQEAKEMSKDNVNINGSAKRRGRGGALMEGSRCSRVNGRGWRCCQQTLVGYSLCEHHLGKGRLRSMNSVRNRSLKKEDEQQQKQADVKDDRPLSNTFQSQPTKQNESESLHNENEQEEEDQKPLMMTKKRVKLGMVKARSISSLLGQNDNSTFN